MTCRVCSQPRAPQSWEGAQERHWNNRSISHTQSTASSRDGQSRVSSGGASTAGTSGAGGAGQKQEQLWGYLSQVLPSVPTKALHQHSPRAVTTAESLHQPLQASLQRTVARGGQKTKFAFFCHFQNLFANITFLFYLFRENYTILHSTV